MKKVRYSVSVELQLKESIDQLVERGYFSEEDYAVSYIRDLVTYFQLNLDHLTAFVAPESKNQCKKFVFGQKSLRPIFHPSPRAQPDGAHPIVQEAGCR